jgi:hypothetical protein
VAVFQFLLMTDSRRRSATSQQQKKSLLPYSKGRRDCVIEKKVQTTILRSIYTKSRTNAKIYIMRKFINLSTHTYHIQQMIVRRGISHKKT